MSASDNLQPRQFKTEWHPRGGVFREAQEYPTTGYRKNTDRVTAQQRLLGVKHGYDPHVDAVRKGITPNMN